MPATRDSLILRITQHGDPVSWEEFCSVYQPFLYKLVRRWGLDDHDACDIVQDVFVILLRTLPQFEYRAERGRFRGWLKTIVQRITFDRLRRRSRSREVAIIEEHVSASLPAGERDWDAPENRQLLQQALREIRAASQESTWRCFEEQFLKGRPAAEVGRELGLTDNAVWVNASRIWRRVRARCAKLDAERTRRTDKGDTSRIPCAV